jgi:hypothetical protein
MRTPNSRVRRDQVAAHAIQANHRDEGAGETKRQEHLRDGAEDRHLRAALVLRTKAFHDSHRQVGIGGSQLFANAAHDGIARLRWGRPRVDEHARRIG